MIIPFAPGGGTDIIGRVIAQKLTEVWPQSVVTDNRAGAGSVLGTDLTAKSKPDGYTIETVSMSHALNASLYTKLPYDPVKDFAPVILAATAPNVLVVHPSVPARTVRELIALATARPGQLNFSSSGSGGVSHLAAELFRSAAQIDIVHVPYKGAGPAMTALLSGEVQIFMATAPVALTQMSTKRLRALAIAAKHRSSLLPGLPTIAESGLPGFEADTWYGVVAPAGTSAAIVSQINADIRKLLQSPETKKLLEQQGTEPAGSSPEEFGRYIQSEIVKWGKVIKAAGIKPE
jgi:tripartite-type tricarboxylate transporter receptor subunit TctC